MARRASSGRPVRRTARRPASRRVDPLLAFDALAIEGAILQPEMLARIAAREAGEQAEAAYGLDPKEKLRDVVQTKFPLAQSLHARFAGSDKGDQAVRRFLYGLFAQVFEFTDLQKTAPVTIGERVFPIGYQALGGRVPVVFAPYGGLDTADRAFGDGRRARSPAQMLQEYLNAADGALWGLVSDGARLRLYRDNAALTRPAAVEAELERMLDADQPLMADFSALWLLVHASRFGSPGAPVADCPLERWREAGREQGATARERLREGVEAALLEFGRGFLEHPDNGALRAALSDGSLSPQGYLEGLLRLVYRFLFVFTAEDRGLLHTPAPAGPEADSTRINAHARARALYSRGYALARLRERAVKRRSRDRHGDGWEGVRIVFRALWRGEPALALPALGGLFADAGGPRAFDDCALSNERLYEAVFRLGWLRTEAGLERVNWRDMETEELGSVYESLLELTPQLGGPERFGFVGAAGNTRKTTASYYTPDSLVQALLDETLDPLIDETVAGKDGQAAIDALLRLTIIDPACGSGHFLLAAARRLATRCAQLASPGAPSPADFRHWLREAARTCLYGVDKNPLAVELAKVALWIETVEPGKPLSFLDAHIRCGDSLLGVYDLDALRHGLPDEAFKPLTGDDKAAAKAWAARNRAERKGAGKGSAAQGTLGLFAPPPALLDAFRALERHAEDDLAAVEAKAAAFGRLMSGEDRYRLETACDFYVAAFLLPKTAPPSRHAGAVDDAALIPTTATVWDMLAGRRPHGRLAALAVDAAREARAFHWPLEFPHIVANGGFSLALGNPPWERIKLQEQEFFAARDPAIATAPNKAARQELIDALADAPQGSGERRLHQAFFRAKREAEAASLFARLDGENGGRFPLTGTGDVNTYALFAELFATLAKRAGVLVPTGIATDATTAPFFASLADRKRLFALIDFENRDGIFTAVHRSYKFCILALAMNANLARFSFFLTSSQQIIETDRHFFLKPAEIAAINPNTRTAPVFRSRADAELTRSIYARVPVLIDETKGSQPGQPGNPWGIHFARLFDMSNDSGLFRTGRQLAGKGYVRDGRDWLRPDGMGRHVPLYEAKMVHHFDHRWATYNADGTNSRDVTPEGKADPAFDPTPRYWVPETEVADRLRAKDWTRDWLMGWRDICRSTDERTVIAAVFPISAVGHTLPLFLFDKSINLSPAILANWSSLVFDYVARQKVGGTHLTYGYLLQFPMLPPSAFTEADLSFIVPRVLELTYTSHSMRPFAEDLGYQGPPFGWDEERRALLRAELDAWIARLYGLTRDQLRFILDPADIYGPDYPSETFRVLKKNEIKAHGEYRTARLVLAAWDRLARGELAA